MQLEDYFEFEKFMSREPPEGIKRLRALKAQKLASPESRTVLWQAKHDEKCRARDTAEL